MAKGYKIKRYSNIYRRNPRRRVGRVILVVLTVAVLFGVGWMVYQPVYDLLLNRYSQDDQSQSQASEPQPADSSQEDSSQTQQPAVVVPQSDGSGPAIYLSTELLADSSSLPLRLERLKASGMNSILIDLKDSDGRVLYGSQVEAAAGSVDVRYDLAQVTAAAETAGLEVVGRLWAFQDQMAATLLYDSCVKYNDTTFNWLDREAEDGGKPWLNPYADEAQQYLLDLMTEASQAGVKNFVLMGVQFPSGLGLSAANYGAQAEETSRPQVLSDFMTRAEELAAQTGGICWYGVSANDLLVPGTDPLGIYGGNVAAATQGHRLLVDLTPSSLSQETVQALQLDAQQQANPVQVITAQLERLSGQQLTPYLAMDNLSGDSAPQVLSQLAQQPVWQACEGYMVDSSQLLEQ